MEELTLEYKLSAKVCFHGDRPKSELIEYYKKAHMLFLLSKSESFGQVLLESWSTGTIFIGSDIPVFRDIISNNIDGQLFPVDSLNFKIESIANFIMQLTQEKFDTIVSLAHNKVNKYEWSNVVDEYSKILK